MERLTYYYFIYEKKTEKPTKIELKIINELIIFPKHKLKQHKLWNTQQYILYENKLYTKRTNANKTINLDELEYSNLLDGVALLE